jgi:hypothetical protein
VSFASFTPSVTSQQVVYADVFMHNGPAVLSLRCKSKLYCSAEADNYSAISMHFISVHAFTKLKDLALVMATESPQCYCQHEYDLHGVSEAALMPRVPAVATVCGP